jgi:hypothetical protein
MIRKRTDPTPFSPRDSQGSCQSAEQGDYKRSIYNDTNPNYYYARKQLNYTREND